jgi:hypothetical protein
MSNHLMQRLAIAREDPSIRQAIPQGSFRSQQQAMAEAQMMRAAILAKGFAQQQQQQQPAAGSAASRAGAAGGAPQSGYAAGAPPSGPRPVMAAGLPRAVSAAAAPALPFVFRRAAQDVQITDPVSYDILQLDRGTWVLTAAAADPATNTLAIYTTDADTGGVLSYQVPLPEGKITRVFDQSTLNPLDTVTINESA